MMTVPRHRSEGINAGDFCNGSRATQSAFGDAKMHPAPLPDPSLRASAGAPETWPAQWASEIMLMLSFIRLVHRQRKYLTGSGTLGRATARSGAERLV